MQFRDSQQAFAAAITAGKLSTDPQDELYAGRFMYMCTVNGEDQFKHSVTRLYLHRLTDWHDASIDECDSCIDAHNKAATLRRRAATVAPGSCRDCGAYGSRDARGFGISCGCAAE